MHDHAEHIHNKKVEADLFALSTERLKQILDHLEFFQNAPGDDTISKQKNLLYYTCYDPRLVDFLASAAKSGSYAYPEAAGLTPALGSQFSDNALAESARRVKIILGNGHSLERMVQTGHNDCLGARYFDDLLYHIAKENKDVDKIDIDEKQMLSSLGKSAPRFLEAYRTFSSDWDEKMARISHLETTTAIVSILTQISYLDKLADKSNNLIHDIHIKEKLAQSNYQSYVVMASCTSSTKTASHDVEVRIPELIDTFHYSQLKSVYERKLAGEKAPEAELHEEHENGVSDGIRMLNEIRDGYIKEFSKKGVRPQKAITHS